MNQLWWRMPTDGEPTAHLRNVTVAEVAEALEAPVHIQFRKRIDHDILNVYSLTMDWRAVSTLLVRTDGSVVWRIVRARPMTAIEFDHWLRRTNQ